MPAMGRYEELCAEHEWQVPERYNIAADVCDKHPRDKPAMIWERYDGARRDLTWGELQDLSNQAANVLRDHGVARGERVAVVLPPTPETAAIFFGTWKNAGILLSMSVLYGDEGIAHRLRDSQPAVLVTDKANAPRFDTSLVGELLVLDEPVGRLVGEVLQLAPGQVAARTVEALPHHGRLVARVLVADVGGDVVALGHVPLVVGAELFVGPGPGSHRSPPR